MELGLTGKNALVCGGSKGIGKAAAIELALLGANITLASRSADLMTEVTRQLDTSKGQNHNFLIVDFSNSNELLSKVKTLTLTHPIHILINNTGGPPGGPILNADIAAFKEAFHNHLICNHLLTTSVIKGMKKEGYGRIINVISTSVKQPIPGLGVSNTIRGAVANWSKTMANELGPFGITVNNVLPGSTNTDRLKSIISAQAERQSRTIEEVEKEWMGRIPLGRFADPAEVGGAIAFLASPAASYISGINLPVDGNRTKSL